MAAGAVAEQPFTIHEDVRTEETEMVDEENPLVVTEDDFAMATEEAQGDNGQPEEEGGEEEVEDEEQEDDEEDEEYESSDDEHVDRNVLADMRKLIEDFPSFAKKYRLIKRIGEGWFHKPSQPPGQWANHTSIGTFSTVYKAEDKLYDYYNNDWKDQIEATKWTPPPVRRRHNHPSSPRRPNRYVAIKKIYVTSSPSRIFNELDLLNDLRNCPSVCPLITAFRHTDQVIAVLPYFRHSDFRSYFRDMTIPDIAIYLRSLFTALKSCHEHHILHRDIKPTNFLYDPSTQHGVLVDFGLAEREGTETKPCLCHEGRPMRRARQVNSVWAQTSNGQNQPGYPKNDTRPSKRANRAGTRGFRAPEVLFKCTEQTTAIDIWSAGVILLTILSKRFPFFNSADDVEAMIEIATIFGSRRMKAAGLLHGCVFETTIPTVGTQGFSLEKIILWSTCRNEDKPLTTEEKMAVSFLERCMELDPSRRITAEEALQHEFLKMHDPASHEDDNEMDMLNA
ncbi:Cell cycle serine/threonine-protein kinase-like protein [Hapsidospora chrysogenum ATCC 11550]|uniref:non-specific serine/threonine protein kinase n=1 Tax=Hapsidospora chrysogenum (strain ATCC 11550 / CBS 779.69 / DSM 880 / IAM 14645 / JCM 23072 / IMI 49137) TaxID=857340 RepID=A0A086T8G5_HAPC1|nr:Cell cycle serine/threonine-protein kinase-like protein [Hapsidospora chrysogenum ATCC 11550]